MSSLTSEAFDIVGKRRFRFFRGVVNIARRHVQGFAGLVKGASRKATPDQIRRRPPALVFLASHRASPIFALDPHRGKKTPRPRGRGLIANGPFSGLFNVAAIRSDKSPRAIPVRLFDAGVKENGAHVKPQLAS